MAAIGDSDRFNQVGPKRSLQTSSKQACNAGGCGPWSETAITTVLLPPPAPASISIPASSNGPVGVSWAASTTATSYFLRHALYQVTGWSTVYSGGATSYTGGINYEVRDALKRPGKRGQVHLLAGRMF